MSGMKCIIRIAVLPLLLASGTLVKGLSTPPSTVEGDCKDQPGHNCSVVVDAKDTPAPGHQSILNADECCVCEAPPEQPQLSEEFQRLADDFWQWLLQDRPEFATRVGFHDFDHRLTNMSLAAYDKRLADVEQFLARAETLEANLTRHQDLVNMRVLKYTLQTYIDGASYQGYLMTISNLGNPKSDLRSLLTKMPRLTYAHYMSILQRLHALPEQMAQIEELMALGVEKNITLHEYNVNRLDQELAEFISDVPRESPIFAEFFKKFPETFLPSEVASLQQQAEAVIRDKVTPAFIKLKNFMSTKYVPRKNIAIASLPNGDKLYAQVIQFYTGQNLSAQEIHETGLKEVQRIAALMQQLQVVYDLGYNQTLREFVSQLQDDPTQQFSSVEELLAAHRHVVHNITIPAAKPFFNKMPAAQLKVEEQPDAGGAFYDAGTPDGTRPGTFKIGTRILSSHTKLPIVSLSLHEGVPGHHLQISHALESSFIPKFRRTTFSSSYTQMPSSFPTLSFYGEGWALYAESLGFEMGVYENLRDRLGHYSDEIFRACRLVVDTGIHAFGWSKEQAIQYMLDYTIRPRSFIEDQVDRYIAWPAQALSYKIGQMQISSFRASAEQQLGDQFNLKDFHDVILNSVGPMDLVKEEVQAWVDRELAKSH
ncbi:uncharacterized protein LOC108667079 isoform X2 [Hyalella azteca]|uniref:Uncharacterized protein LOC108667079 isoform X2 n=1 Tax=Hyalella azteca TaxID=294128 RepID=A0A8B7N6N7_HYAAZ|nr:uncharacterized protein LOC108667079 isoform X2 [Hyalella azteca]